MIFVFLLLNISFDWYSLPETKTHHDLVDEIYSLDDGSSTVDAYGGKKYLLKMIANLDAGIFKGGCMVLIPNEYRVDYLPRGLKLMRRAIEFDKYKRYSAIYRDGKLKSVWEKLKLEAQSILNVPDIEKMDRELMKEILPRASLVSRRESNERISDNIESDTERMEIQETESILKKLPAKRYYSFISVTSERGLRRLIPVILTLSPSLEIMEEFSKIEDVEEGVEK